ncbi:MAG: hypothetical protein AB3X44_05810 [Leptothrix sp. (in: b-proteobacteria)]
MTIRTSEEAKTRTVEATSRRRSHEESLRFLEDLRRYLARATDEPSRQTWQTQISALEKWLASEEYQRGDYPQGIDELVMELIEWRAMQHAFQNVETKSKPFLEHVFYQQWLIGSTYAVSSLLGKLVGKTPGENSLRKLWWEVGKFVSRDGACTKEELTLIADLLDKTKGKFTDENSRAMKFRNTVIAHNQKSLALAWDEIDKDVQVLVRIWSILVSWSSFGIIAPFRSAEQAFSGLERLFEYEELSALKKRRKEYIDLAVGWTRTNLHSGARDPGGSAFTQIVVTSRVFSQRTDV